MATKTFIALYSGKPAETILKALHLQKVSLLNSLVELYDCEGLEELSEILSRA